MAQGLTRAASFSPGLPGMAAADIEAEFVEIHGAFDGSLARAVSVLYTQADYATLSLDNTGGGDVQSWKVLGVEKALVNSAGQLESVLSTGTAPLVAASTGWCENLNLDQLDGEEGLAFSRDYHFAGTVSTTKAAAFQVPSVSFNSAWSVESEASVTAAGTGSLILRAFWVDKNNGTLRSSLTTVDSAAIVDPAVGDVLSTEVAGLLTDLLETSLGKTSVSASAGVGDIFGVYAVSGPSAASVSVSFRVVEVPTSSPGGLGGLGGGSGLPGPITVGG